MDDDPTGDWAWENTVMKPKTYERVNFATRTHQYLISETSSPPKKEEPMTIPEKQKQRHLFLYARNPDRKMFQIRDKIFYDDCDSAEPGIYSFQVHIDKGERCRLKVHQWSDSDTSEECNVHEFEKTCDKEGGETVFIDEIGVNLWHGVWHIVWQHGEGEKRHDSIFIN